MACQAQDLISIAASITCYVCVCEELCICGGSITDLVRAVEQVDATLGHTLANGLMAKAAQDVSERGSIAVQAAACSWLPKLQIKHHYLSHTCTHCQQRGTTPQQELSRHPQQGQPCYN